ncbi:MAG: M24 family metallopeptidase [Acidimicrobiales bacterium]
MSELPPLEVPGRLHKLRPLLVDAGVDALLVTDLSNVRYLTGFSGSAGVLLVEVARDRALLVTDGRYRTQAAEQLEASGTAGSVELGVGGAQAQRDALAGMIGSSAHRVGIEAEHTSWASKRRFAEAMAPAELVATAGLVEALREVKDAGETARISRAAEIADAALGEVLPMIGQGTTEADLALALEVAMRRLGAEDRAFETIVASGPNSAKPHAQPTGRHILTGDPVVIDFGATFDGYRSDMTRTFCAGRAPAGELARVFEVVRAAQAAGVAAVKAGVEAGDVDSACRDLIAKAGWAEAFEHSTGHGVGLDIHEVPAVASGSTAILAAGTVVTVEPGVYLPTVGGVRIEDTVVVTGNGCSPLTTFTKDVVA